MLRVAVFYLTAVLAVPVGAEESPAERIVRLSLASPYKIPPPALRGHIRYRFMLPEGDWRFPETGEQRVIQNGREATLDICLACGSAVSPDGAERSAALSFNPVLDTNIAIRRMDIGGPQNVDATMQRLTKAVANRLNGEIRFDAYWSASKAYARRAGDCTESAVLLAAAARSRGIPARVVYGWVYSSRFSGLKHHFSPHMWVQAWDGTRWTSYDAGMGAFGAGHIALAVGHGQPSEYTSAVVAQKRLQLIDLAQVGAPAQP
jgi:hypothetical protein